MGLKKGTESYLYATPSRLDPTCGLLELSGLLSVHGDAFVQIGNGDAVGPRCQTHQLERRRLQIIGSVEHEDRTRAVELGRTRDETACALVP